MRITTQQGNLASLVSGQTLGPAALWPGYADTQSVEFSIWPPDPTQTTPAGVSFYNIYRDGVRIYGDGVGGAAAGVGVSCQALFGANYYPWFVDNNLASGVTHNYTARAVIGGVESSDSPVLTRTTLINGPSVPPTVPVAPSTWVKPLTFPTGGTTWVVTDTTPGSTVAGTIGPTGKLSVNCGFQYALNNLNVHGGDIVECHATTFPTNANSGFTFPLIDGTNGPTFFVSDQAPEYRAFKGLTGGTLPPASTYTTKMQLLPFALSATPALNATSVPLAAPWALNTGLYFAFFPVATAFGYEERQVLLTNGSVNIDWNPATSGALSNNLYPQAGLRAAGTAPLIQVAYGNHVTETNAPSMATFSYTTTTQTSNGFPCWTFPAPAGTTSMSNVWFIGIRILPRGPSTTLSCGAWISWPNANGSTIPYGSTPAEHVYFDRCLMGNEPGDPNYAEVIHGIGNIFCNHFVARQCQFYGCDDSIHGVDSNALLMSSGGPNWITNCYTSACAENIIAGGIACDQPQTNNMVYQYNLNHKPLAWFDGGVNGTTTTRPPGTGYARFGYFTKNLFELKIGKVWDVSFNLLLNCPIGNEPDYFGAGFALGVRDQTAHPPVALNINNPWNRVADINIHDNDEINVCCGFISFTGDQGTSSLQDVRIRYANNRVYLNSPLAANRDNSWSFNCMKIAGPSVDHIIDHNTLIVNSAAPGAVGSRGIYFYNTPGYGQPAQFGFTPNGWTTTQDRLTLTNNIFVGITQTGTATFQFDNPGPVGFANYKNLTTGANLTSGDSTTSYYPVGTFFPNVPVGSIGFKNFQGVAVIPVNPDDWNVTTGTFATSSTTAGPLGAVFTPPVAGVTITNAPTLNAATVGVAYAQPITVTGGTGPYRVAILSMAPHRRLWCWFDPSSNTLRGTPQYNETSTLVLQAWDANNVASTPQTFTIAVSAAGALAVVTNAFPNASNGGMGQWEFIASGGVPPYVWGPSATLNAGSQWAPATGFTVEPNGFMTNAPTAAATISIAAPTVRDSVGTVATGVATTVTIDNTLRFDHVDTIDNIIRLPNAYAGRLYGATGNSPRFTAAGGTPPYNFSGAIANMTVSGQGAQGTLAGTASSAPGTRAATITVTDSATPPNTATATAIMTVLPFTAGVRPPANTGVGAYVAGGVLYDSNNVPFLMRGYNRDHFDQPPTGWAKAMANASRDGTGALTVSTSTYVNDLTNNLIAAKTLPTFPIFCYSGNLGTSGTTDPTELGQIVQYLFTNFSAYQPLITKWILNFANEWGSFGGGVSQTAYKQAYLGVIGHISSISGTTITLSDVSAGHPFATSAYGFVTGVTGLTSQVVNLSAFGGVSGAWTMTSSVSLGTFGAGGTINAGVAALRAAGYVDCPIMIDASGGTGYYNLSQVAAQIQASDPQQNCIFSWHPYNSATPFEFQIRSVAISSSNTILTMNVNATQFGQPLGPFENGFGGATSFPQTTISVVGATGPWAAMNGNFVLNNGNTTGGSAFSQSAPFTVTIPFNASAAGLSPSTYVSNSAVCFDGGNPIDWALRRAADRANGVCWVAFEFGPYGTQNVNTPTCLQLHDVIQACESYQLSWNYWAWDDLTGNPVVPETVVAGGYGMVGTNGHPQFTTLGSLTLQAGQALIFHPRMSCHALAIPASNFLP